MSAILYYIILYYIILSCIDDEVAFVHGVRENSINPSEAAACPSLLTSSAICMTAGFSSIKCTTFFVELLGSTIRSFVTSIPFIAPV
jgi:hypothetical protein